MDDGLGWMVIIFFVLGVMLGGWGATVRADRDWRAALVDRPAWVEAVRVEVVAERNTQRLKLATEAAE